MPRSAAETSKRALGRIQRLCCLGMGSEMLMPDLMREVTGLMGARNGFFLWMASDREITKVFSLYPALNQQLYLKEFHGTRRIGELMPTYSELTALPVVSRVYQYLPNLRVDYRVLVRNP